MNTVHYLVRFRKDSDTDWGASIPDLPGCVATGKTLDITLQRIRDAMELHLLGMRAEGLDIPQPTKRSRIQRRSYRQVDFQVTVQFRL